MPLLSLSQTSKIILRRACQVVSSSSSSSSTHASSRSRHTIAIARNIPNSFVNAVVAHHNASVVPAATTTDGTADGNDVSLALARAQHQTYLTELRKHIPTLCLPSIESHPDCLFVEDTVVAIGNTAVITRMGHDSRRGEVDSIKRVLRDQLGMANVYDMREDEGTNNEKNSDNCEECAASCDGGDVMYTGRHLFVGMSERTNTPGFRFLRDAFAARSGIIDAEDVIPVPPVVAGKEALHLKSAVTHLDERTLLAPTGRIGDAVLSAMRATELGYDAIVRLPNMLACNVVVVDGRDDDGRRRHVLAQDVGERCEVSKRRLEVACEERGLGLTFVDTSELAKKDGALTCCSVLLGV